MGYRNEDRKLYIAEAEAETIQIIYDLYVTLRNVRQIKTQLDVMGLISRLRIHKSGKRSGGKPFTHGHIYRILTNPIYIGKIQHRDKVYAGIHKAIIDTDTYDQVQTLLKANAIKRTLLVIVSPLHYSLAYSLMKTAIGWCLIM